MLHSKDFNFSFSGLKTAVLTVVKNQASGIANVCEQDKANIARGFVDAIVDVLTAKCVSALKHTGLKRLVIAGGVGANRQLRAVAERGGGQEAFKVYYPELEFCTDNGAMIAFAGALRLERNPEAAAARLRVQRAPALAAGRDRAGLTPAPQAELASLTSILPCDRLCPKDGNIAR